MKDKLSKISDSFLVEKLEIPTGISDIAQTLKKTKVNLDNLYNTLLFTIDNLKKYLVSIHHNRQAEGYSVIKIYKQYLKKNKHIFVQLNKMRQKGSLMIGLFWVPKKYETKASEGLSQGKRSRSA